MQRQSVVPVPSGRLRIMRLDDAIRAQVVPLAPRRRGTAAAGTARGVGHRLSPSIPSCSADGAPRRSIGPNGRAWSRKHCSCPRRRTATTTDSASGAGTRKACDAARRLTSVPLRRRGGQGVLPEPLRRTTAPGRGVAPREESRHRAVRAPVQTCTQADERNGLAQSGDGRNQV